jgi:hypothetical protein
MRAGVKQRKEIKNISSRNSKTIKETKRKFLLEGGIDRTNTRKSPMVKKDRGISDRLISDQRLDMIILQSPGPRRQVES